MPKKLVVGVLLLFCLGFFIYSQDAKDTEKKQEETKTWKIPVYMLENLNYMVNEFNRTFKGKVDLFKQELKANFKGFENMPEDVILDLNKGIFVDREYFIEQQEKAKVNRESQDKEQEKDKQ